MIEIRRLAASDLNLIAEIDRTEQVRHAYRVEDGALVRYGVEWDVPPWRRDGAGPHTIQHNLDWLRPIIEAGGIYLGAFDGDTFLGMAIIQPRYEPGMAWLAFLHVSRPYRARGVGVALWTESERIVQDSGATTIYVSATPSGPTIDFYLSRGCTLPPEPHPDLFAKEPEDIHLMCEL